MRQGARRGGRWAAPLGLTIAGATGAALLLSGPAAAEPVFTGRISLTGLFYTESDNAQGADPEALAKARLATNARLGYADLRALFEGKRLWQDRLDLRLDLRVRLTGSLDFERKFAPTDEQLDQLIADPAQSLGTTARGYLGGPEYELREAYGLMRLGERYTLQLGRMYVREGDMFKLDGVRLVRKFGAAWEGSLLLGGAPNPYSRSLLSDYTPPCGAGVAGARELTVPESVTVDAMGRKLAPCQEEGPQLSMAVGLGARYNYSTLWGTIGLIGNVVGGPGDGGPVQQLAPADVNSLSTLAPPDSSLDRPRVYLAWMNSWRPLERLDLFSDIVFDFYGSAGPQLTRLLALATVRLLRDDKLALRLGYTHMSSLAIDMFLNRQVYNRRSGGTLGQSGFSIAENNLTVLRTGRDEVRASAELKLWRRLGAYVDARFRYRGIIGGDKVETQYTTPVYDASAEPFAGDFTLGVRDGGSWKDLRAGLSYTALLNFRARNHVITLDLGRDFFKERLGIDFQYVFVHTTDKGIGDATSECPTDNPYAAACFGWRSGMTNELGLTVTAVPWRRLFLLLDYRLAVLSSSDQARADLPGTDPPQVIPTVISNAVLLRAEFRW